MEHVREIAKRVIAKMEGRAFPWRVRSAVRNALIDYRLALQGRGTFDAARISRTDAIHAGADDEEIEEKCYRLRQLWAAGRLGPPPEVQAHGAAESAL